MTAASYSTALVARPAPGWLAVTTTLRHFSIVTYAVPPDRLRAHVPERFAPEIVRIGGAPRALVSAVSFLDTRFRSARFWSPAQTMGQTNYRLYVVDTATGARVAWFFGTTLDSIFVAVPRLVWKMPWHRGRMSFDCDLREDGVYARYRMWTTSDWAPVDLDLEGTTEDAGVLDGFDDLETGLVVMTHPLVGFFNRRDGRVATYSVWHDRLRLKRARARASRWGLFDSLGLVPFAEQATPHSVLVQPETDFTIYLPPVALGGP